MYAAQARQQIVQNLSQGVDEDQLLETTRTALLHYETEAARCKWLIAELEEQKIRKCLSPYPAVQYNVAQEME